MKVLSWNVNGLRSVHRKGFLGWLDQSQADLVCLQEIKAKPEQLSQELIKTTGFHAFFHPAEKSGYSGVAIYSRQQPLSLRRKIAFPAFDREGRFLRLDFPQFSLINLYLPHGQRDKGKLAEIVGLESIIDDPAVLEEYSHDMSFTPARQPELAIVPRNTNQVKELVDWANRTLMPLIPVSSGPPHFRIPDLGKFLAE